jgi:AraC-like DNA-binding protein
MTEPAGRMSTLGGWTATLVRALDAQGIDGKRLALEAGIDPASLADPDARVPRPSLTRLWRLAVDATGDECFGLTASRYVAQTTFHALGYAVLASGTLREAFERIVRFRRLIGDIIELKLVDVDDRCRFVIDVSAPPGVPYEAVDAVVAVTVRQARLLRGDARFSPLGVMLQRPEPAGGSGAFRRALGAPVAFAQPINAIDYARADCEDKLPTGNAELARQNDEVVVRYLSRVQGASLSLRVQQALLDALPDGAPGKEHIARAIGMSPRNLQRHLAAEGTSFKQLLNDARVSLARSYVAEGRLTVTEIAFLLGFADTSTFSRAFKRWTGKSPRDYAVGG